MQSSDFQVIIKKMVAMLTKNPIIKKIAIAIAIVISCVILHILLAS